MEKVKSEISFLAAHIGHILGNKIMCIQYCLSKNKSHEGLDHCDSIINEAMPALNKIRTLCEEKKSDGKAKTLCSGELLHDSKGRD